MPDQPFDVRKVIEQSASKTTLQELAKKGIHRVKVLDEQMINKLIHDAVEHILGSKTSLLSEEDREKLVKASRGELDKLIKDFNSQKDKSELLTQDKDKLASEVESLQKALQVQRQLGDQLGKQALEQGKSFAKGEIEMLHKKLELKDQELEMAKKTGGEAARDRFDTQIRVKDDRIRELEMKHAGEIASRDARIKELERNVVAAAARGGQEKEAEANARVMAEMQKNVDLSQKLAKTLEDMRVRDDEIAKKMEALFTKSIEGISKKLTDLKLRALAGGGLGGGAGVPGEEAFRQSSDVIAHMLGSELESNLKAMEPTEGKTAGKLGNALERLKAMRGGGGETKKEEKKE